MKIRDQIIREIFNQIVFNKTFRNIASKNLDKMIYKRQIYGNGVPALRFEKLQKYAFNSAVLKTVCRNLDLGYIKPEVTRKMVEVFTQGGLKVDRTKTLNPVKEDY